MRHLLSAFILLLIAALPAFATLCDDWNTLDKAIRDGKIARPKRSPTHLHFMCLSFNDGKMTPYNTYRELLKTEMQ